MSHWTETPRIAAGSHANSWANWKKSSGLVIRKE
jgi:hypothetical protein